MICPYRQPSDSSPNLDDAELFDLRRPPLPLREGDGDCLPSGRDTTSASIRRGRKCRVAAHLHQHAPRWNGDANFMPIVAQTRTMPILLSDQRDAYAQAFEQLAPQYHLPLA